MRNLTRVLRDLGPMAVRASKVYEQQGKEETREPPNTGSAVPLNPPPACRTLNICDRTPRATEFAGWRVMLWGRVSEGGPWQRQNVGLSRQWSSKKSYRGNRRICQAGKEVGTNEALAEVREGVGTWPIALCPSFPFFLFSFVVWHQGSNSGP